MTDEKLVEKFINENDEQAFNQLYEKYHLRITYFIKKYVNSFQVAEDLMHETFIKVHEKISDSYSSKGYFKNWLYTVAKNTTIDHLRAKEPHADMQQFFEENDEDYFDLIEGNIIRPDQKIESDEGCREIVEAISELNHDQRIVLLLRVVHNMKFKDIAEILDEKLNTVLGRMRYARENIERELQRKD